MKKSTAVSERACCGLGKLTVAASCPVRRNIIASSDAVDLLKPLSTQADPHENRREISPHDELPELAPAECTFCIALRFPEACIF